MSKSRVGNGTVHDTKGLLSKGLAGALGEEDVNALLALAFICLRGRGGGLFVDATVIKDVLEG